MADPSGFSPVVVNSATYIGTLVVFLLAMKVPGISLTHFPATGSLLVSNNKKFSTNQDWEYLFIGLWSVHFLTFYGAQLRYFLFTITVEECP